MLKTPLRYTGSEISKIRYWEEIFEELDYEVIVVTMAVSNTYDLKVSYVADSQKMVTTVKKN